MFRGAKSDLQAVWGGSLATGVSHSFCLPRLHFSLPGPTRSVISLTSCLVFCWSILGPPCQFSQNLTPAPQKNLAPKARICQVFSCFRLKKRRNRKYPFKNVNPTENKTKFSSRLVQPPTPTPPLTNFDHFQQQDGNFWRGWYPIFFHVFFSEFPIFISLICSCFFSNFVSPNFHLHFLAFPLFF